MMCDALLSLCRHSADARAHGSIEYGMLLGKRHVLTVPLITDTLAAATAA